MIVSHKHRFIFVKTRKTAGTSIEVFLSSICGDDDIVTPIEPHVEPHRPRNDEGFYNHMPAATIRQLLPEYWDQYFSFCVERDPWDKTLSFYHMLRVRSQGRLTFDDYLDSGDFCVDHGLYTDSGEMLVDYVLRYENLNRDLSTILGGLGVPFEGSLNVRAKSEYRIDRRPCREVYTPDQARRVADAFAWEIKRFGYSFS
jgi:hypothetical protein